MEKYKESIQQELHKATQLKKDLQIKNKDVDEFIKIQKSIKATKIIWAFGAADLEENEIIQELRNNNFNNIYEWKLYENPIALSKNKCDFMIYAYAGLEDVEKSLKQLEDIVSYLNSVEKRVPLLIFTYNNGKRSNLSGEEINLLNTYKNYSIATTPGNFKSQFYSLLLSQGGSLLKAG